MKLDEGSRTSASLAFSGLSTTLVRIPHVRAHARCIHIYIYLLKHAFVIFYVCYCSSVKCPMVDSRTVGQSSVGQLDSRVSDCRTVELLSVGQSDSRTVERRTVGQVEPSTVGQSGRRLSDSWTVGQSDSRQSDRRTVEHRQSRNIESQRDEPCDVTRGDYALKHL